MDTTTKATTDTKEMIVGGLTYEECLSYKHMEYTLNREITTYRWGWHRTYMSIHRKEIARGLKAYAK